MSKKNAMDTLEATRDTHQEAWAKLGKVIARKRFLGRGYKQEQRLKTRVASKIGRYNSRLLEVQAATTVVKAPTVAEVKQVRSLLKGVRDLAIKDAMLKTGLNTIKTALSSSSAIAAKIRI